MHLPRRHLLQLGLLSPLVTRAAEPESKALADLLKERLRHEGVGLAAARLGPGGALELAAAGRFWLSDIEPRANLEHARILQGAGRLDGFAAFRR